MLCRTYHGIILKRITNFHDFFHVFFIIIIIFLGYW